MISPQTNPIAARRSVVILFAVVALGLVVVGWWYYRMEAAEIRVSKYQALAAIGELKSRQIQQWRKERQMDADRVAQSYLTRRAVEEFLQQPEAAPRRSLLREHLKYELRTDENENVLLFSPAGELWLAARDDSTATNETLRQCVLAAAVAPTAVFSDFYRTGAGDIRLAVGSVMKDASGQPLAVAVLIRDPEKYLYPLIESWPMPSHSAESLLVRREGDAVLFLNRLRHGTNRALTLKIPLTRTNLPATQAVLGRQGVFEGTDYRGVSVLAAIHAIPDSPWFMVAKMDRDEALAEQKYRATEMAAIVGLILLLGGAALWHHHRVIRLFQNLYEAKQRQLAAQEAYRITLYSIGDGVITTDDSGRVRELNPVAEQMTGWREAEARGHKLQEVFRIINETTRQEMDNPAQTALRENRVVGLANHAVLISREGKEWPIADSAAPICAPAGEVTGVVLVFSDQTRQHDARQALEKSEERHRLLFEQMIDGFALHEIICDSAGRPVDYRYLSVNPAFERMTGLRAVATIGHTVRELMPATEPVWIERYGRVALTGEVVHFEEYSGVLKRHFQVRAFRAQAGQFAVIFADVTDRHQAEAALRESEERHRSILQAAMDGYWLVSQDGRLLDVNAAYCRMSGYTAAELLTKHISDLDVEETPELVAAHIRTVIASGEARFETRHRRRDGSIYAVEISVQHRPDHEGRFVVFCRDIAERKQMQAALEQRLVALTRPLDQSAGITFEELFNLEEIQRIQDEFAEATGVASIITRPDGSPITRPSKFTRLCQHVVRHTEAGRENCHHSDACLGRHQPDGPIIKPCLSCGLWDAGASISVGDRHIASWLIGQVRTQEQSETPIREYARSIGADETEAVAAFGEVPMMPLEHFKSIARALFTLANQLSAMAYQNVQQARFITERSQAEESLRASRELVAGILNAIPVRVFWKDLNSRYLGCNNTFAADAGYASPAEVVGQDDFQMSWRADAETYRAMDRQIIATGDSKFLIEETLPMPDGSTRTVLASKIPLRNARGEISGVLGTYTDITERKEAEATSRLQGAALQAAANAIVITDREGRVVWGNAAFARITGYTVAEVTGKKLKLLCSGKHDPAFYQSLWETILAGRAWHGEIVNRRKDGSLYTEDMMITPLQDERNGITHFIAVKQDITRRKMLEEQFHQAQKMEAFGQLAGGVAHDFNNILTVIQGNAAFMQMEPSPEGQQSALEQITEAARRAANLTRQLLAFSRRQIMQARPVDINGTVTSMGKMFQRLIGEHIALQILLLPGGAWVQADPAMIEQILLNLAINARDAMPEGGRLAIGLNYVTREAPAPARSGRFVCLSVQDTGAGIAPEHLPRIFEPFFTTKDVGKGTGLGLATVHGIVEQHQGCVEVESQLGVGTIFRILLPRLMSAPEIAEPAAVSPPVRGGAETILLVEDEPALRKLAERTLKHYGYQVISAPSGAAALKWWREQPRVVDLLLTDIVMPGGISGRQLAETLQAENPAVKVVYMSGYPGEVAGRGLELRAGVNFLQKPFAPARLAELIRDRLDAGI